MRKKQEIIEQHGEVSDQNLNDGQKARLHEALKLEVAIDTRDTLVEIAEHLKCISSAAQIYQEHNPV